MPRVRFGQIHIVNCLYSSSVTNYCVGAGYKSNIYVEKSAFTSTKAQKTPWKNCATSSGYTDYNITLTGNTGASDVQSRSGSNSYFNPYSYYSYRIATLDYLAQGNDGLIALKEGTNLLSPQTTENNVRFIIMNYFREQEKAGRLVDSQMEGRIVLND